MNTIYVDTSVFGGKFDDEFELWTGLFFEKIFASNIQLLYSNVAEDELKNSPEKVKAFVNSIPAKIFKILKLQKKLFCLPRNIYLKRLLVKQAEQVAIILLLQLF